MFACIELGIEDRCRKILWRLMSESVLPVFALIRFVVSGLRGKSSIHCEFVVVHGMRE